MTPGLFSHLPELFSGCQGGMSSWISPQDLHLHLHVHEGPLGLGEVFDGEEVFEDDPVGEVFEDDPGCVPVGDKTCFIIQDATLAS